MKIVAGKMPNLGSGSNGTSNPNPIGRVASRGGPSLGVQDNYNLANFVEDPETYNDTPAKKKSYSWNKGETGNAN
jgi:hypothetical protein